MERKEEYVVGYLGGSITEGAGASCDAATYRSRVTAWLQDTNPQLKVKEINAGIGGTGSSLGVCRMDHDLLWANPDLVFVEFAVNDDSVEETLCLRSVEGIVRKLLAHNPEVHIVFLYTITKSYIDRFYQKGALPDAVKLHQRVAEYYGIPSINVGLALYEYLEKTGAAVTEYLPDTVHPNDQGYELYAKTIQQVFPSLRFLIQKPSAPLTPGAYEQACLLPAEGLAQGPWKVGDGDMMGRFESFIACDTAGAELIVPFTGTLIGIYWTIEQDSGVIEYSIDGGPVQRQSAWDRYALSFNRACSTVLDTHLEEGPHQLQIRIAGEKDAQSNGRWIRIGAFLACP